MDIPGGSINAFSAITITNGIDAGYIAYNDDATISSDVDENVAEHAKILLAYFNEMYKAEKAVDLSLHWDGNHVKKLHRLLAAAFCRKLDLVIFENQTSPHIKVGMSDIGLEPEDVQCVVDFLYSGKIFIRGAGVIHALEELGCYHILPFLQEVWSEGCAPTTVEDKFHAVNLLNRISEFRDVGRYCDFSFCIPNADNIDCHKWVIAAYCSVIEQNLRSFELPIIHMEVDTNYETINHLVTYLYTGHIFSFPNDVDELKKLDLNFGVRNLREYLSDMFLIPLTSEPIYGSGDVIWNPVRIATHDRLPNGRNRNLTSESDYVGIYNEYVEGPKLASYRSETEDGTKTVDKLSRYAYRFQCPSCSYKGCDRTTIRKHIRCMHTKETPYVCSICGSSFKIQSNYARHMRTHSKVKPYKCKECGCEYADKKNMDAHVFKAHLKREAFKCPFRCPNAKFFREDSWLKHYEKKHKNVCEMPRFELRSISE